MCFFAYLFCVEQPHSIVNAIVVFIVYYVCSVFYDLFTIFPHKLHKLQKGTRHWHNKGIFDMQIDTWQEEERETISFSSSYFNIKG